MKESLISDILQQAGSLHTLNDPSSIGYVFNPNKDSSEIATGMYASTTRDLDEKAWTYFVAYKDFHLFGHGTLIQKGSIYRLLDNQKLENTGVSVLTFRKELA